VGPPAWLGVLLNLDEPWDEKHTLPELWLYDWDMVLHLVCGSPEYDQDGYDMSCFYSDAIRRGWEDCRWTACKLRTVRDTVSYLQDHHSAEIDELRVLAQAAPDCALIEAIRSSVLNRQRQLLSWSSYTAKCLASDLWRSVAIKWTLVTGEKT
jgi:hypothetical protein